jgi:ankyrin repeat protein
MERIESKIADIKELAKQVLSWITCARRPLTTSELQNALAVEIGEPELDKENLPALEDMVSVCAGLVTVDEESDIIRLVHYTTQEYFERTWIDWFPDVQRDIATTCVIYLSFDTFATGFCPTDEDFEARLQLNPLYDYAARNWGHHARAASTEVEQRMLDLLKDEAKVSASCQAMMVSRRYSQNVPRQITGLHLTAYFGLKETIIALLKDGHNPDIKDAEGRTPLAWAAKYGHEAMVELLLTNDNVDPDSRDNGGQTPLSRAAMYGNEATVKLLLEKGAELESKDNGGQTPFSRAAMYGTEAVMKLLLEKGAELESKDNGGRTPLSWAAMYGNEAVVKLLLEKGAELESKDNDGRTPLWWAAISGNEAAVKLLLEKGAELESKDIGGRSPLSWAAETDGNEAAVKLLLEKGAELESKDNDGRTPLSWAAVTYGNEAVVKLLKRGI